MGQCTGSKGAGQSPVRCADLLRHPQVEAISTDNGLSKIFSDLNVAAVIRPEQVGSLSALEILRVVGELPCDKVIILPNHRNIFETALTIPPLTKKSVAVIPAENIPQGISRHDSLCA